jgi:hypothetical protein
LTFDIGALPVFSGFSFQSSCLLYLPLITVCRGRLCSIPNLPTHLPTYLPTYPTYLPPAMSTASPTKRRVLGALDANACSPRANRHVSDKLAGSMSPVKAKLFGSSIAPRQSVPGVMASSTPATAARVDAVEHDGPAAKRPRLDDSGRGDGLSGGDAGRPEVCSVSSE